jgi:hypothetical protein
MKGGYSRIELNSPSIESLLTSKVPQRVLIIFNTCALNSGSSSRKEDNTLQHAF